MPSVFISGLGSTGRRHLQGVVRAGFDAAVSDPDPAVFDVARRELAAAGLPVDRLRAEHAPRGHFDAAIFCETAPSRLASFQRFLSCASVDRILLEKPLSADPEEWVRFTALARERGVESLTQVNMIRRTWPHVQRLAALCAREREFAVTLNGGAVGIGCAGIHDLDTFLLLAGEEAPDVAWCVLSNTPVASGRGSQFEDFGADFVLRGSRARLLASLEAGSSAGVVMTVRGAHFLAIVDYTGMKWELWERKPGSSLPNYRYGADYRVTEEGALVIPPMDAVTEQWVLGRLHIASLAQALITHQLLDEILRAGGAHPPYRFT